MGLWCNGITFDPHSKGSEFNSWQIHFYDKQKTIRFKAIKYTKLKMKIRMLVLVLFGLSDQILKSKNRNAKLVDNALAGAMISGGIGISNWNAKVNRYKEETLKNKYIQSSWDKFESSNNIKQSATEISSQIQQLENNFSFLKSNVNSKMEEMQTVLSIFLNKFKNSNEIKN